MPDAAYSLWRCGNDRFAVTPTDRVVPVLGYVSYNVADGTWVIERAGRMLPQTYRSVDDAAQALVDIEVA